MEALGHVRSRACPGLLGPGPDGPLAVNSGVMSAVDRHARAAWALSWARLLCLQKSSSRKHKDPPQAAAKGPLLGAVPCCQLSQIAPSSSTSSTPDATHEGSFCPSLCRGAGSRPQATPEVSTLTPNTSDPEVMAGSEGLRATKPPSFLPS